MLSRVLLRRPGDPGTAAPPAGDTPPTPPADAPPAPPADAPPADTPPAPPAPDTPPAPEAPPAPPVVPEKYALTLPENAVLDAASLERIAATARAQGLSQEAAQAAVVLANQEAATVRDAVLAAHAPGGAEWAKNLDAWKAETLADPALGKTVAERTAAINKGVAIIDRFAASNAEDGAAMKAFLIDTGLGEHPTAAKFFVWLGKSAGEQPFVPSGDPSGKQKSDTELFYANTTPT